MRALNDAIRDLQSLESDGDVFVMNSDGSGVKQLTDDSRADQVGSWCADGQRLIYTSTSMNDLGADRFRVISAETGKQVSLAFYRQPRSPEV